MSELLGEDPNRFRADAVYRQQIFGPQGGELIVLCDAVRREFSTGDLA